MIPNTFNASTNHNENLINKNSITDKVANEIEIPIIEKNEISHNDDIKIKQLSEIKNDSSSETLKNLKIISDLKNSFENNKCFEDKNEAKYPRLSKSLDKCETFSKHKSFQEKLNRVSKFQLSPIHKSLQTRVDHISNKNPKKKLKIKQESLDKNETEKKSIKPIKTVSNNSNIIQGTLSKSDDFNKTNQKLHNIIKNPNMPYHCVDDDQFNHSIFNSEQSDYSYTKNPSKKKEKIKDYLNSDDRLGKAIKTVEKNIKVMNKKIKTGEDILRVSNNVNEAATANPIIISQINQATDEMLLKYQQKHENLTNNDDSLDENEEGYEEDFNELDDGTYSSYSKINEFKIQKNKIIKAPNQLANELQPPKIIFFKSSGLLNSDAGFVNNKSSILDSENNFKNCQILPRSNTTDKNKAEDNESNFPINNVKNDSKQSNQQNELFYETTSDDIKNLQKILNTQKSDRLNNITNKLNNKKHLEEHQVNAYNNSNRIKTNNFNLDSIKNKSEQESLCTINNANKNIDGKKTNNIVKGNFQETEKTINEVDINNEENNQKKNNSGENKDKKNATANCFGNNSKMNKTGGIMGLTNYKTSRSTSGKIQILSLKKQKILISNAIPDYAKHFGSFNEVLNGFYIPSETKGFDAESALRNLYENFKNLYIFEMRETSSPNKFNSINRNIVEAENEIIKNRIRKVSEFLLHDQNYLSEERYYIFKKIQELQKKEHDVIANINEGDNCEDEGMSKDIEFFRKNKMFFRVVLSRPEIYDIMCYTLGQIKEWQELPHGLLLGQSWNLLWTYSSPGISFANLFAWQKVNHFINNRQLSRKDLLKKSIERIKKMNTKLFSLFDIMPKTYILAKEYLDFVDEFTRNKNSPSNIWIVKPVGKSRGRGIYLIKDLCDVPMVDSFLVQKYLTNPYLIEGYKFDMRIYVLVTSVNPLEAFLYKDGFARVSNMKFSIGNIDNKLVHLTNAAIQNKIAAAGAKKENSYEKVFGGSKISLELLKQKMMRVDGIDFDKKIWPQINSIILKSLIACQHEMPYCPSSFELFGYDIIVDSELKCLLLEVNSSPSLDRTSVLDDSVKLQLVGDILNLVNPMNFDRAALLEVLERRLNINKSYGSLNKNFGNQSINNNVYLYSPTVQLNLDLNNIFKGEMPRAYGEIPKSLGNFEMIAPSDESNYLIKITGGEKKFNNKKT